jgi:hypothetical protein
MAADPAALAAARTDVAQLFEHMRQEEHTRQAHLERLTRTLDAFRNAPHLMDDRDLGVTAAVVQKRAVELETLRADLAAVQELYDATVRTLETQIQEKTQLLHQVDADFGAISAEPELCRFFAQEQATLTRNLEMVKQKLVQAICDRLGPTLYGSGAAALHSAGAAEL